MLLRAEREFQSLKRCLGSRTPPPQLQDDSSGERGSGCLGAEKYVTFLTRKHEVNQALGVCMVTEAGNLEVLIFKFNSSFTLKVRLKRNLPFKGHWSSKTRETRG